VRINSGKLIQGNAKRTCGEGKYSGKTSKRRVLKASPQDSIRMIHLRRNGRGNRIEANDYLYEKLGRRMTSLRQDLERKWGFRRRA